MRGTLARRLGFDTGAVGIYLNDHLMGATAGGELARRAASSQPDPATREDLHRLAREIHADREALLSIMADLDVPVRRYKVAAGWIAEKAGRLKLNGRLLGRPPLTGLIELELLRLGVEGKARGWESLRRLADVDDRVDAARVDALAERARAQIGTLERLRVRAADVAFRAS
ncbi:hypothetical protein [Actinomadura flavalba]|uniref:hypothetical protein n=1 Tax=Actinomadura flavalba TaxID=1120938 RepID=UPI0003821E76|nr:hypothetical protein [Actinomadura flavalba]